MDSAILMLFNSSKGARILAKENEGDLHTRSVLIYLLFGALIYILYLGDFTQTLGSTLNALLLFFVPICVAIYGYLLSRVVFYSAKLMGSKMAFHEMNSLVSYSVIPMIMGFITLVALHQFEMENWSLLQLPSTHFVVLVSVLFSAKIVVVGVWKLGKINLFFALLSILPTLILPLWLAENMFHLFDWETIVVNLGFFKEMGLMYFQSFLISFK
tara:strand:+ start:4437 stop:5078 length:642 start_codon:yes stop_codon:yes gene_type:complete